MYDLKSTSSSDHQGDVREWKVIVEQGPANHFIDRVVSADVFPNCQEFSRRIEGGRGVQSAGPTEDGLLISKPFRQSTQGSGIFSYIMAKSREYMRRAREGKVEDLAAAENDDQYHQSFLKYSVLIISSSVNVA